MTYEPSEYSKNAKGNGDNGQQRYKWSRLWIVGPNGGILSVNYQETDTDQEVRDRIDRARKLMAYGVEALAKVPGPGRHDVLLDPIEDLK